MLKQRIPLHQQVEYGQKGNNEIKCMRAHTHTQKLKNKIIKKFGFGSCIALSTRKAFLEVVGAKNSNSPTSQLSQPVDITCTSLTTNYVM